MLDRKFFEKLEQNLLPGGQKYLKELLGAKSPDWEKIINKLLPFIKNENLGNALVSQLLSKGVPGVDSYLSAYSDKLVHHKLYSKTPRQDLVDKSGQIRGVSLPKTGSELFLMGGDLIGKVIVRIVARDSFLLWKKAFESEQVWRDAGFDYIPIEPIIEEKRHKLKVSGNAEAQVPVTSKVLGKSMFDFLLNKNNRKYIVRLWEQRERIISVLKNKFKILHGHDHAGNFCVEMHNGEPRLYLIDWDQAKELNEEG